MSSMNDSNKMTTRQWFDKEKKEKNNSVEKLREVILLFCVKLFNNYFLKRKLTDFS